MRYEKTCLIVDNPGGLFSMKLARRVSIVLKDTMMALSILIYGHPGLLLDEIRKRIYSEDTCYGLRRDLNIPFEPPAARIPLTVRPLRKDDIPFLLADSGKPLNRSALKDHLRRIFLFKSGIHTCYVAATMDDKPCYMQWLVGPEDNEKILRHFKGGFPPLGPDEMLLEGHTPLPCSGAWGSCPVPWHKSRRKRGISALAA